MFRTLLESALLAKESRSLSAEFKDFACVALLVLPGPAGPRLGFITRAEHPKDPWSGQIGLPGGRRDPGDASDLAAVLRELQEEIGLRLQVSETHVRLHDVQARRAGAMLPFFLRPFVFVMDQIPELTLDPAEVGAFHWVELAHLLNPEHQIDHGFERNGVLYKVPGVRLPSGEVLWGLTYVVLTDFLERIQEHEEARKELLPSGLGTWRKYPGT